MNSFEEARLQLLQLSFRAKRGIQVFTGGGNSAGAGKNLDSSLRSE
jgi:hypothetical protein